VLTADITPDSSTDIVSNAIGGYFLGVDVLDSVWKDYKFTAPEVVADNTSGGGFLLAGRMSDHIESGLLRMFLNGELQAEGHTEALGDPVERLIWLAQCVGGLSAGMIIFLGSPAAAVPAKPGTLEVFSPNGHVLIAKIVT
jgi:2-keto-4-pentenoate hydratase